MITEKEYRQISKNWKKGDKVYQKYNKLKKRLPMIENNIDFFKGAKVLELGSNAGMYALCLYRIIAGYTGIEVNRKYYKQSKVTLEGKDVTLINEMFEFVDLDKIEFDLFLASYVLHHLNDDEIKKLNTVFERCNKVVIHTRSGDPFKYGHDEIGANPLPHWNTSKLKYMLKEHGYESDLQLTGKRDYNGIYIILAKK